MSKVEGGVLSCPNCPKHTVMDIQAPSSGDEELRVKCLKCGRTWWLGELVKKPYPPIRIKEGIEV